MEIGSDPYGSGRAPSTHPSIHPDFHGPQEFVNFENPGGNASGPRVNASDPRTINDDTDFLGRLSETVLGASETDLTTGQKSSVLQQRFRLRTEDFLREFFDALCGGYLKDIPIITLLFETLSQKLLQGKNASTASGGSGGSVRSIASTTASSHDISNVSVNVIGDWWAPLWIGMSVVFLLFVSRNASRLSLFSFAGGGEDEEGLVARATSFSALYGASFLVLFYLLATTAIMVIFARNVSNDPTFFSTATQRQKLLSFAGYSLAPSLTALVIDNIFFGFLSIPKTSFLHACLFILLPQIASASYLSKRFPTRFVTSYAPHFDAQRAQLTFWIALSAVSLIFVIAIRWCFI